MRIIVDGKEVDYWIQGSTISTLGGSQLAAAITAYGGTFYSIWGASTRDTVAQAIARTKSEMVRLSALGVQFGYPPPNWKTDNVVSITGTSIDAGFQASHPPSYYLPGMLSFTAPIYNGSISGQASMDMDAGFEDREGKIYNSRAAKNIAWHGGVTNSVCNYLQNPIDAFADVLSWARKAKAQGWKTVVSTMISRQTPGYNSLIGDQLAQQFNALLLANGDEFDWVANVAAPPELGALGAYANTTYFADGVHPNDTGQQIFRAIFGAGINGVYGNPLTGISGSYTHLDADRMIVSTASANSIITLKSANLMSFNRAGRLTVVNNGSGVITLQPASGQTINGASTATVASGEKITIQPFIADPTVGGAVWVLA